MKTTIFVCLSALFLAGNAMASPPVANPEGPDMDMDITAKIMKEKSRRGGSISDGMRSGRSGDSSGGECGSININSNNAPKSNSGIRDMFGKQSTTIITGPVINMPNCK
jgi:hypothetical protein